MKIINKRKSYPQAPQVASGAQDPIIGIQQQLASLEKKLDGLIAQLSARPPEARSFSRPFQGGEGSRHQGDARQNNNYRDRVLHKAVCADCHKECEVPFKPSQDRPVYCKDCFSKRKVSPGPGGAFKKEYDNTRGEGAPQARRFERSRSDEGRKFAPRGRSFGKARPGEDRKFNKRKKPGAHRRKKGD